MTTADQIFAAFSDVAMCVFVLGCLAALAWACNGAMHDRAEIEAERRMQERIAMAREAEATRRRVRQALDGD